MTTPQMHTYFRQYAQQMGLQNTRAILPEQIDILINTSITDTVNQLIRENIAVSNDRDLTDNSKLGQINALKPLYRVSEIECFNAKNNSTSITITLPRSSDMYNISLVNLSDETSVAVGLMYVSPDDTLEDINYRLGVNRTLADNAINKFGLTIEDITEDNYRAFNSTTVGSIVLTISTPVKLGVIGEQSGSSYEIGIIESNRTKSIFKFSSESVNTGIIKAESIVDNYLFLVDFSINYIKSEIGLSKANDISIVSTESDDEFISNYFPIRLIDDIYLADTLNDFILKPRLRTPVLVIYNNNYDLYIDKFTKGTNGYFLVNSLVPYKLRVSYIAKPAIVKFAEDIAGVTQDCDLPEYMHVDIVKHAVDLYRVSVTGALFAGKQQQEAQQRENARNYNGGN